MTNIGFVIEDHQIAGGLGSVILEEMSRTNNSFKIKLIGIEDEFGKSGSASELYEKYGLERTQLAETIETHL
jgi:transketolase